MFKSLSAQVLLPPVLLVVAWVLFLGVEQTNRVGLAHKFDQAVRQRDALERGLLDLEERHGRAMRRAREAMHDARPGSTHALLRYASAHYLTDMDRSVRETLRLCDLMATGGDQPRLDADIGRMKKQLGRIFFEAQRASAALDGLLEARPTQDDVTVAQAQRELEKADRAMATLFLVAEGMARGVFSAQAQRAAVAPWVDLAPLVPIMLALSVLGLWLSGRPLARLRRLSTSAEGGAQTNALPRWASREEHAIKQRMREARSTCDELRRRLEVATLEAERGQHAARRTEHDLALLRFYNDNLVNSLRSAIVVTDAAGTITGINRTARRLLGLDERALGTPMHTRPPFHALQARNGRLADEIQEALLRRTALRYEAVPYAHNGHDKHLLLDWTLSPYQDESGAARGLLWVADDVTDAVHTKHQLLVAERLAAVGRLSAQVAHEIRNPLSAIGLNAELLEEEFVDHLPAVQGQEARLLLRAIAQEIERLTEVTETYLHLARLPRPNLRSVDVNQLIRDLFVMQGEELRTHGIEWHLDLADNAPATRVDPGQLRQALLNIIRNSREAMTEGGTLSVTTLNAAGGTEIAVRDTGHGIPREVLPRVFEPFYSTKAHGTGLGLSLTQQIVAEHGGTVRAAPNLPRGAQVVIQLPDPAVHEELTH